MTTRKGPIPIIAIRNGSSCFSPAKQNLLEFSREFLLYLELLATVPLLLLLSGFSVYCVTLCRIVVPCTSEERTKRGAIVTLAVATAAA